MRFATFSRDGGPARLGLVIAGDRLAGERLLDLADGAPDEPVFDSMLALIDAGEDGLRAAARQVARIEADGTDPGGRVHPLVEVRLHAPIPRPRRNVFCVGMNYPSHVEDNARALGVRPEIGAVPLFFTKPPTAVVGPLAPILLDDRLTRKLDYEVELAVVIGRGGSWIPEADALDHVFGYTLVNDVSARDIQWRTSQMFIGKGLDSYCPMGPWIVTGGPNGSPAFELTCRVNGEERQRDTTEHLVFPVARIIAELSKGLTLEPGDVIATGTPGGCGYQLQPPRFLEVGDVVECRADGIGSLVNPVAAWAATAIPGPLVMEAAG